MSEKRFNGKAIYNPSGKAGEYSYWACNYFTGCSNECEYCYCKKGVLGTVWSAKPQLKKCFRNIEHALDVFCNEVDKNEEDLREHGLFFSFTTDPMLKETKDLTWASVIYATSLGIPVKILTKRADIFDLSLENFPLKDKVAFGFTLTGHDELEPGASTNMERIQAMYSLHKMGYKTFASIEPVVDFVSAYSMISLSHGACDLYKIGLMSGKKYNAKERSDAECFFEMIKGDTEQKFYLKDTLITLLKLDRDKLPEHFVRRDYNLFSNNKNTDGKNKPCPEFPYWGATYPDARCVNGKLYDLDRCDENGNLYEPMDDIPCPFCQPEEFIECDPFNKADNICEKLMEDDSAEQYDIHIDEAKAKAREWYLNWIKEMRVKYA